MSTYVKGETSLIWAVQHHDENLFRALIYAGVDVNTIYHQGKTALFYAVQQSHNEGVVRALIDAGAGVNITNNEGKTALFYAVQQSHNEGVVRTLIDAGAGVNVTDEEGKTALFYAVQQSNNEGVVRTLIDAGGDVNITDEEGKTALFYAVQKSNNERVIRVLIHNGADVNVKCSKGQTVLFYSVRSKLNVEILFDESNPQVDAKDRFGRTPLFNAMEMSLETAGLLIGKGADLNVKDNCNVSILLFIIGKRFMERDDIDISKALNLFKDNGVTVKEKTIFKTLIDAVFCLTLQLSMSSSFSVKKPSKSLFDALETAKVYTKRLSKNRRTINEILNIAGKNESESHFHMIVINILKRLVDLGANPNSVDLDGNTALHYAARLIFGNLPLKIVMDICLKLKNVRASSSFNIRNHQNETPVLFGLTENFINCEELKSTTWYSLLTEVYKFLIENGSSVDDIEKNRNSVFHLILNLFQRVLDFDMDTRKKGLPEVTKLFQLCCDNSITKRVTMNTKNCNGNSPLHFWARIKWIEVSEDNLKHLQALAENIFACGAELNNINENGETPLHLCTTWNAVHILLEQGANPRVVDFSERSPLLSAALRYRDRIKGGNFRQDAFYEDVSASQCEFWIDIFKKNLDPWAVDKNGQSLWSVLIESEAIVVAKTFIEASRTLRLLESDTTIADLLNVICKDKSTKTAWKRNLVEILLQSRKNHSTPFQCNGETPLHSCCRNIIDLSSLKSTNAENNGHQSTFDQAPSASESESKREEPVMDLTKSVHWKIAKLLLLYGADITIPDSEDQSCLDIAKACPALSEFLKSPVNIEEVPLMINSWKSVSKTYLPMLSKVARGQECNNVHQYRFHRKHIAKGSFGFVFAGISEKDGREVAIKRIENSLMERPEDKREITNLTALSDCDEVVRYLVFFEDESFSYIILELMEGNLEELLDIGIPMDKRVQLCLDVVKGLNFLHTLNIIHRDLKPKNILYKIHPKLCLKIADFGLSREIDSTSTSTVYGTNAGTRCWIAPEVLTARKDQHSPASDMFSCGLVLHYILSVKKHPFFPPDSSNKGDMQICSETERNIIDSKMEGWAESLNLESSHLIKAMLDSDKNKRHSAAEALDHPFFWSNKKKVDLLKAVGNQSEFECPRARRTLPLTAVETDLETRFGIIVKYGHWNDPRFVYMPAIYTEMTTRRRYRTDSVVELVRFIRNAHEHVSDPTRPQPIRKLLLEDFVFLEYFPNLTIEVYKVVTTHGWNQTKEEIKYVLKQ